LKASPLCYRPSGNLRWGQARYLFNKCSVNNHKLLRRKEAYSVNQTEMTKALTVKPLLRKFLKSPTEMTNFRITTKSRKKIHRHSLCLVKNSAQCWSKDFQILGLTKSNRRLASSGPYWLRIKGPPLRICSARKRTTQPKNMSNP